MRGIEKRLDRLEEARAAPKTVDVWIIEDGMATSATTGEAVAWGELSTRPVSAHEYRAGVLIVDPIEDRQP